MKITRNQAEDFVHFGEDHYSNLKILKDMIYVYWGAAWILWIPFAVAGRGLVFSITMTLLALAYNIAFWALKSNRTEKTYRLRFLTNSISFLFMYLLFYLFTIFFINVSDVGSTLWQDIELTICFITFPLLNILFTFRAIKRNVYDREKPQRKASEKAMYVGAGFLGMCISRFLEPFLSQSQAISIIVILVEILLLLISFASPNILRLYFAYKYNIVASIEGETTSKLLICNTSKKSIGIRVLKSILKLFIIGFAILMLYAMNQVS